jgi:hypothetical protein
MQFRQAQPKRATCGAWKSSRERVVAARLRGCRERERPRLARLEQVLLSTGGKGSPTMTATLLTNETPGLVAAAWLLVARWSPGSDGRAGSARGAQGPPAGGAGTPGLLRTTDDAGVA